MSEHHLLLVFVFIITFVLILVLLGPEFGLSGKSRRRLRERILEMNTDPQGKTHLSLLRERYLRELSPLERRIMTLPGMDALQVLVEQAGSKWLPHRVVLASLGFGIMVGALLWFQSGTWLAFLPGTVIGCAPPILLLKRQRAKRLTLFEEQLGDALTIAARSMRAGMPFTESLNLVSQEMPAPLGKEFGLVYTEINYGGDVRSALLGLLERMPSITVTALVASVMIQRDTGGNLAEVMEKLAGTVRERFRFQRNLLTLSADGRMQQRVMTALPFVMTAYMQFVQPDKLAQMLTDPLGRKLITWALVLMILGTLWIRRIVNKEV